MALIALEGMRFYAYHGFYPEEQIIGNEYVVDIYIDANTQMAAATDDLYKTVNYETIYIICQAEMRKSTQLLETLVQRMVSKINNIFGRDIKGLKVRIKKMNPPLRGRVNCSFVEIDNLSGKGGGGGGGFQDMSFDDSEPAGAIPDFGGEEDLGGLDFGSLDELLGEDDMDFDELDMDFDDLDMDDFSDLDLEGFEFEPE